MSLENNVTIALDLGGTFIKMALIKGKELLAIKELSVEDNSTLKHMLPIIEETVSSLSLDCSIDGQRFLGIGMAFPCIVDSDRGIILSDYVKYADVNSLNLKEWARDTWGITLTFENDARAALVGEWQYGAGFGKTDIVLVTIGTGIGSAVLISSKLLKGKHYLAGNLGWSYHY